MQRETHAAHQFDDIPLQGLQLISAITVLVHGAAWDFHDDGCSVHGEPVQSSASFREVSVFATKLEGSVPCKVARLHS